MGELLCVFLISVISKSRCVSGVDLRGAQSRRQGPVKEKKRISCRTLVTERGGGCTSALSFMEDSEPSLSRRAM